jgi:predicted RNA-binding protein associated with RNAse of E/G family
VVGGEDRTFMVVKGNSKPRIVRKAKYKKAFIALFGDDPDFLKAWKRRAKFKDFAQHITLYNELNNNNARTLSAFGN